MRRRTKIVAATSSLSLHCSLCDPFIHFICALLKVPVLALLFQCSRAASVAPLNDTFDLVAWTRPGPALFLSLALASSAVGHQNLLVGAAAVAAVHAAAQATELKGKLS
jgi:hypothetical protein